MSAIRTAIICPDQNLSEQLRKTLVEFPTLNITRVLSQYPDEASLFAFLKASAPDLIFLSAESPIEGAETLRRVESQAAGTPIVAFNRSSNPATMLELLRAGAKDFLTLPFDSENVAAMLARMEKHIAARSAIVVRQAPLFAFLPSKPGVGATTVAVNTSLAMARMPDTKPILIDLDLNNGLVEFMLSLKSQFSVTDAAEHASDMDETLWSKIVSKVDNLDVLVAGAPELGFRIETAQIRGILEFGRRNYSSICVDLSGMMEKYSLSVLEQAKQIFIVSTPEVASMHLTCAKLDGLRKLGLGDRVNILVNRVENSRRTIPVGEMESVFQQKIFMTLPNSYEETRQAGICGKPVKPTSSLGVCFAKLAQTMLLAEQPVVEQRRGIFDRFRVSKADAA